MSHRTAPDAADLAAIVRAIATGDPDQTRAAITQLGPILAGVYDLGETAWHAGAPADFLAATLYTSARHYLRLHAHAVGATDSDLHTHKRASHPDLVS